jgi:hypothetical protein
MTGDEEELMKGFSHFVSGVAAASFVPNAVRMSAEGSFVMLLAGLGALLPDTFDFKLARFLVAPDVEIDPCLLGMDAQAMAERMAEAIELAHRARRVVKVQLYTVRVDADTWRQYEVRFPSAREIVVHIGPRVNLSQEPYVEHNPVQEDGRAEVSCVIHSSHGASLPVDILAGPMVACRPREGDVEIEFLPWHRRWSHSILVIAAAGGLLALLLGQMYGLAFAIGAATHVLQDQMGHLGSSLFYPLVVRRIPGLRWFHSGDVLPNLLTVWASAILILYNLDRFGETRRLDPKWLLLSGLVLPCMAILGAVWLGPRRRGIDRHPKASQQRQTGRPSDRGQALAEIAAEMEEETP